MQDSTVSVEIVENIAMIRVDNPPVNATSLSVRCGLADAVAEVVRLTPKAAVLLCSGKTFIAGGDMSEFDAAPVEPHLPDVVQLIEDCPIPFIAAMHGTVLGGGLETAMGCDFRIAVAGTRFGLPEVNVGLIPGAGGTQRLPRLVGLELAIEMCASGAIIDAETFLNAGGLDKIVYGSLEQEALIFAKLCNEVPTNISKRLVEPLSGERLYALKQSIAKKAKGQRSPLHNMDAALWSLEPFGISQPKERALHLELRKSNESKALRHAFFAERSVAKPAIIEGVAPKMISNVLVVGGGLMGSGIATALVNAGMPVTIAEQDQTAADAGRDRVEQNLNAALERGLMSDAQRHERLALLSTTTSFDDASAHDLAIEAVFEDREVKQSVFISLASVMREDAILATNTSYLDPRLIFEGVANPSRCVGLHFFSPAHIMKLLEVVRLPETSAQTLSTAFALAKSLRKVAIISGICDGFIGNRMLAAYRREAEYLLVDGALPEQIDAAIRAFGLSMGPFETQDMSGLQIAWENRKQQVTTRDRQQRYISISDELCELGRFGQRSGKGWYLYPDGPRSKTPDSDVQKIIEAYSERNGIQRQNFSEDEIVGRLTAVLANEGALIVEEGIAENEAAVDMVKLHGYGFPRWRGGPMHYANSIGANEISKWLKQSMSASPNSFKIAKVFGDRAA